VRGKRRLAAPASVRSGRPFNAEVAEAQRSPGSQTSAGRSASPIGPHAARRPDEVFSARSATLVISVLKRRGQAKPGAKVLKHLHGDWNGVLPVMARTGHGHDDEEAGLYFQSP
jgi:hypothetical protein